MAHDEKHDHAKDSGGCCGGATAAAGQPKAHAHAAPAGHHPHHPHAAHETHGKSGGGCCASEVEESDAAPSVLEVPKPAPAKMEKKADGGGCCSH